ncbi:hypothetical protein CS063_10645 [Sporanaerobium hydrogeniformans]|uniref:Uncharacterized protein n=1 Tax=Sporanaerobium hydrogeniformans TaxID=3072179 RepID=A0AC61DCP3_9FIRM|nr:hypothetical protein [Sporanaerobium hydrogeniformans]PHV70342.1 hypothetical protein CS063_10645 [Sporanaerobium hydrogeniformans]
MATLLTRLELEQHLQRFRSILSDFDYSSLGNIRFLNLDAFYAYMDHVEGNPFQLQYKALQQELDAIQPYLPFVSSKRAKDFLDALSTATSDQEVETIKKEYTGKLRQDFIQFTRTVTTDVGWEEILRTCEEIRTRKEEMLLAIQ